MALDRGILAKIDRRVFAELGHAVATQTVKVPLSDATVMSRRAGYQSYDVVFGEPGGGFVAEERFEAPAFLRGVGDPPSHGCSCFGFGADDAAGTLP